MLKTITRSAQGARRTADPDEIRRARETAGLTQEQLADVLHVLPVEIGAWESGAISLSRHEGDMVVWRIQMAEYTRRAPQETPPCDWTFKHWFRFRRLLECGGTGAEWVRRAMVRHQRHCAPCRAAQALADAVPDPPEMPAHPGILGAVDRHWARLSRLPAWVRVPVKAAETALVAGPLAALFASVFGWLYPAAGIHPSPRWLLFTTAGIAWLVLSYRLLRPLGDRMPYLAGHLCSAAVVVPAVLASVWTGIASLGDPRFWIFTVPLGVTLGVAFGSMYDPDTELSA